MPQRLDWDLWVTGFNGHQIYSFGFHFPSPNRSNSSILFQDLLISTVMSYQAGIQSLENRSPIPFLVKGRLFQQPLIHGYSFISIGSQEPTPASSKSFLMTSPARKLRNAGNSRNSRLWMWKRMEHFHESLDGFKGKLEPETPIFNGQNHGFL